MLKSFIDPNKILGDETKAVSPEAFSNFMTGRTPERSSSALSSAANNISNFSRSSVGVKADSNLAPIISNISTSITNNIDNSVSNTLNSFRTEFNTIVGGLQKKVESNLTAAIQNFSKDYQQKISSKEDSSSSKILKDFISVYKTAMDLVVSLGNSRNNKRIESSLKSLRSMFDESFNAAVIIRQTISKIVKQLSNLPTASPKSGGLDLNIEVPGGPLKQQGSSSIGRALKGRGGAMLAAGAVGTAAVGVGALGMQAAQARQEEKLAESAKKDKGKNAFDDFIDGMNNIIKSFSDSISRLLGLGEDKGKAGASASSSSGSRPSPSPGTSGAPSGNFIESSSPGELKAAAFLSTLEATGLQNQADVFQSIHNRASQNYGGFGGIMGQITAREQYSPFSAFIYGTSNDTGAARAFGNLGIQIGNTPEERKQALIELFSKPNALTEAQKLFGKGSASDADRVIREFQTNSAIAQSSRSFIGGRTNFGAKSGQGGAVGSGQITRGGEGANVFGGANANKPAATVNAFTQQQSLASPQTQSRVQPTPPSDQQAQQIQNVTRSPSDQKPSVAVINAPPEIAAIPTGETQSGGGGNMMQLPPASSSGPDVSMYGQTRNPNNPYWFAPFDFRILNMA
jgi:hypothetical protein